LIPLRYIKLIHQYKYLITNNGRTKKKAVGDDAEAPKAPRLRHRVLFGGPQPRWGKSPRPPVIQALITNVIKYYTDEHHYTA